MRPSGATRKSSRATSRMARVRMTSAEIVRSRAAMSRGMPAGQRNDTLPGSRFFSR